LEEKADLYSARSLGVQIDHLAKVLKPDLIHALRIQYEGIAASYARLTAPIAVSTWGSDLITTARTSASIELETRRALDHATALFSDCKRDVSLARNFGLPLSSPAYVVPGNFGLDVQSFPAREVHFTKRFGLREAPLVTYPRGVRTCIDHAAVMRAFNEVVDRGVDASFLGVGLQGVADEGSYDRDRIVCLPSVTHFEMLRIAAHSSVTVSPSTSDGIPNSVLEGMAGGSVPVCSDLESLREIEDNGGVIVWVDPADASSIAAGIVKALDLARDHGVRLQNTQVISRHYASNSTCDTVVHAYQSMLQ
jgi:glycosyltransferase involved in cell wall biosynthesis